MASCAQTRIRRVDLAHSALAVLIVMAVIPLWPQGASAAVEGTTARVSLTDGDAQANDRSQAFSISADGRYVAFESYASNLVAGGVGPLYEVFVRDNLNETTERISVSSAGVRGNDYSGGPAISPDGRYVAFYSHASNLVEGDTNGVRDVFVRDLWLDTTVRVSVGAAGVQANGQSTFPSISYNGSKVVFSSNATNLLGPVPDTNGSSDVFVRDMGTGVVTLVSRSSGGLAGNADSQRCVISSNGTYVAFESLANNLVAGDTNGIIDVFRRNISSNVTERISVSDTEAQANGSSWTPSVSADGRFITFNSTASNLVVGDTSTSRDVFLRDVDGGTTKRVNVSTSNAEANAAMAEASRSGVTGDGRWVTFCSAATNLVAGDTNGVEDVFVRDMLDADTRRISVGYTGAQSNGASGLLGVAISSGARFVFFASEATNVVSGDTNAKSDIFRHVYIGNEIDIAGATRYETAIAASKAAFPTGLPPAGKRTVIIATAHNWPDALGGAALAGVMGGPILLVDSNSVPNDVLDEITRLNALNAIILGGENAVGPMVKLTLDNGLAGTVERIAGASRYETADDIALRVISEQGPGYSGDAIVATGGNFPDALAVAPIAARNGWPLFLSHPTDGLSTDTKAAMAADVQDVLIVGGTGAVSAPVQTYLETNFGNVVRKDGPDRYQTAVNIADYGVASAGMQWYHAGITTGEKFPDALAGAPLQAQTWSVMLLTKTDELPPATATALAAHKGPIIAAQVYGGTSAVSTYVRKMIEVAMQ